MRISVLASGSKGNALVVEAGGTTVLVDCGLTPKVLRARLRMVGLELTSLHALLVTHAHGDHVAGALRLGGAMRLPCYATRATQRQLSRRGGLVHFHAVEPGKAEAVGALEVTAIALPHDAPGTVAYVVEHQGRRLGICTDLGHATDDVKRALSGCDTLLLEFNHDEDMLKSGPYPPRLKQRILSDRGHLSNAQSAALLAGLDTSGLQRLVLAHLSEVNNAPRLAVGAAREVLRGTGIRLLVAPQYEPTRWLDVAEVVRDAPAERPAERPTAVATPAKPATVVVREHIVKTLRGEAPRPAPKPMKRSVALDRQLSLFSDGRGKADS